MADDLIGRDLRKALVELEIHGERLLTLVGRMSVALEEPPEQVSAAVERVVIAGRQLREGLVSSARETGLTLPSWSDPSTLRDAVELVVKRLVDVTAIEVARRITAIEAEIRDGHLTVAVRARRERMEALRQTALSAMRARSAADSPALPWPAQDEPSWVLWLLGLQDPAASAAHEQIARALPELGAFVEMLSPDTWQVGDGQVAEPQATGDTRNADAAGTSIEALPAATLLQPDIDVPAGIDNAHGPRKQPDATPACEPSAVKSAEMSPASQATDEGGPSAGKRGAPRAPESRRHVAALPETLASYSAFESSHWRDANGNVAPAPWRAPQFAGRLANASREAIRNLDLATLVVFSRCGAQLGFEEIPGDADVQALLSLLMSRAPGSVANLAAVSADWSEGEANQKCQLHWLLRVLRHPPDPVVPDEELAGGLDAAGFANTRTRDFLWAAHHLALEEDPLARLRSERAREPAPSTAELEAKELAAQRELNELRRHLWSAAGGRIQRSHCRVAWDKFMLAGQPVFDRALHGVVDDLREIDRLLQVCDGIADKAGVRFQDRNAMDRAAKQLVEGARRVVLARRDKAREARTDPSHSAHQLLEAYSHLREEGSELDAIWVPVLRAMVEGSSAARPALLTVRDFAARPALLESVPVVSCTNDGVEVDPQLLEDPRVAAAHLLNPSLGEFDRNLDLALHLRSLQREDLLVHLTPTSRIDQTRAQEQQDQRRSALYDRLARARATARSLRQLGHPGEHLLSRALDEAESKIEGPRANLTFLDRWLTELSHYGNREFEQSKAALASRGDDLSPEGQHQFERALQTDRFAEALALANGEPIPTPDPGERETRTRREAAAVFPSALTVLQRSETQPRELCKLWCAGLRGNAADDVLRQAFSDFAFGHRYGKPTVAPKRRETSIETRAIRRRLHEDRLNPAFVPQLANFGKLSIVVAPVQPTDPAFVQKTADLISSGASAENRITVVLVPRLSRDVREALRDTLRARQSARGYAVIDDLDFARLINPGGQQPDVVLGLLEIMLEQQPKWARMNPFEPAEGQHTKPEMFVGREDRAIASSERRANPIQNHRDRSRTSSNT